MVVCMSTTDFQTEDATRQERAEQTEITDVRTISGEQFGVPEDTTVYEVDLVNERGETRENVVIIPRILFENTKDVQHRHEQGVVGKYSRALAMESDEARKEDRIQGEISDLRATDGRLLDAQADLNAL